jgi:hypothetical protein
MRIVTLSKNGHLERGIWVWEVSVDGFFLVPSRAALAEYSVLNKTAVFPLFRALARILILLKKQYSYSELKRKDAAIYNEESIKRRNC